MMNDHLIDYIVITLADVSAVMLLVAGAWIKRKWIAEILTKAVNWKLSANVWWLACDLHSVKLLADMGRRPKMVSAINQALFHASSIGMDDHVSVELRKLKETYAGNRELTAQDKKDVQKKIDALIDYYGRLAEGNQPDFKPGPDA